MHEKRVEKALVVDDNFHLLGMITVKDFQKAERKPNSCKDEQGRLRVGAAVGAGAGNEERVDALVAAGVDVLLIDSSHGHSEGVLQRIRETRAKYPDLQIIGGKRRDGRRRSRTGGSRLQRGESRYWPGFHLYHSYRDWRGRSADHRCF
ncbi:inosine 5'-monophosphate dehydrogenase [Salmonella enterica subsp. enterica]|uniref:Inosine 5'-monophosphate dehydrogenase n=1 Tax=Salmonella enterica I TaxID=59201 RepID=A0A447TY71_SALET|nr:inosine 5'-monophosphate dehydrogenase [Salmonella enterica subsp. enterica]